MRCTVHLCALVPPLFNVEELVGVRTLDVIFLLLICCGDLNVILLGCFNNEINEVGYSYKVQFLEFPLESIHLYYLIFQFTAVSIAVDLHNFLDNILLYLFSSFLSSRLGVILTIWLKII